MLELILPDYVKHIKSLENQSMLARIYGLFTIKTQYFVPVNIMIMQNTYKSKFASDCVLKFDLKGSVVARNVTSFVSESTQAKLNQVKSQDQFFKLLQTKKTLKDVNLMNLNKIFKLIQNNDSKRDFS